MKAIVITLLSLSPLAWGDTIISHSEVGPSQAHFFECVAKARDLNFSTSGGERLCLGSHSLDVVQCAEEALDLSFSHTGAIRLCRISGCSQTAECARRALKVNFSHTGARRLCGLGGRPETATCADLALEMNFSHTGAWRLAPEVEMSVRLPARRKHSNSISHIPEPENFADSAVIRNEPSAQPMV